MDDLSLAADFPQATREQWLKMVEGVLKGADFQKKLVSRSHDGIEIQPLYPKAEGSAPIAREEAGRWRISQRVDHPDPAKANELALIDLEGGADALTLVTRKAPAARGFGVAVNSIEDLDRTLGGVMLDLIHLRVDAGGHGRQMAALVLALAERRGHKLSDLSLDLGLDPVGAMAAMGRMSASWDAMIERMGDTLAHLTSKDFAGRAFLADGRVYHEAGASEAQELAAVLATGLSYLRGLETAGHSLDAARRALSFLLVADADEFLTVAKLRALRRLWARVEQACGLEPRPVRLHAETAWRMTTRRDPWVNMLRTTIAAFSAGIGGADAITVLPFTVALGLPDAFARRVARNTQLILLDESNLARVADPAAGAGGFEALTDALCDKAWALFQEIEREGGILESLKGETLQRRIATVRAQREKAVATRKEPITGTSEFPNINETDVTVLFPSPLWGGARGGGAGDELEQRNAHPPRLRLFTTRRRRAGRGCGSCRDFLRGSGGDGGSWSNPAPTCHNGSRHERGGGRSPALGSGCRSFRTPARHIRCLPGEDGGATHGVPRKPRIRRRFHCPRNLCQELLRGRRHRSDHERGINGSTEHRERHYCK